jgi:2-polyprenyl-6-methoxyphenol hydroxylase-like FAD-dependent oxidoreductase
MGKRDMMQRPTIAIVGAGPAGLTAACIFHRHGWPVTVFESEDAISSRDQGGTLDLHADGGQLALEKAGLLAEFLAAARHEDQEWRVLDYRSGAPLAEDIPAPGEGERPEIDRRALRRLLLAPLPPDAVHWGHRLAAVVTGVEGRPRLEFENGRSTDFDIVIGADGAWSRVRSSLTEVQPTYTGITFVELWFDGVDERHPAIADLVGHGTTFALHAGSGLVAQRNGGGHVRVYAAFPVPSSPSSRPDAALAGISKVDLLRRFEGWSGAILKLIADADAIAAVRPIVALPPGLRWRSRRGITLVGDAAHVMPPVGIGVNLAMLDAADLASLLIASSDWVTAVEQFEAMMLARAGDIAREAQIGFQGMFGPDAPRAILDHMRARQS